MMAKCIVTGGAGFIGHHLVNKLIELEHDVIVIDNLSTGKKENIHKDALFHKTDIRFLAPPFKGIDYVFHLAAIPRVPLSIEQPQQTNDANVNGTLNMLVRASAGHVKKFIYSSSSSAYGDTEEMPLREDMLPRPMSPYAVQKLVGEHYCKVFNDIYKMPTVSLRYFNVYGKGQDKKSPYTGVLTLWKDCIEQDKPFILYGDGTQTRDFTHIDDVVNANIAAMMSNEDAFGEVFNIGAGEETSLNDIAGIMDRNRPKIMNDWRIGDVMHTRADIRKAKKILQWSPRVKLKEGIGRLLKE